MSMTVDDTRAGPSESGARCLHLLDGGHLINVYQPIIDLRTGCPIGFEALGRLVDGDEITFPGEFLQHFDTDALCRLFFQSLAGILGLIRDVGVLEDHHWISINVHPQVLMLPVFCAETEALIARHGVDPGRIMIEILECEEFIDCDDATSIIDGLRDIGVKIGIDDLGAGHSSLKRLLDLPLDRIKLDRAFLTEIRRKPESLYFVAAMQALSRGLRKMLIVEGVESEDIREALTVLGVNAAQGYAIARPMPAKALQAWLLDHEPRPSRPAVGSLLAVYATHINIVEVFSALRNQAMPIRLLPEICDPHRCSVGAYLDREDLHDSPLGLAHKHFHRVIESYQVDPTLWNDAVHALWQELKQAIRCEPTDGSH